MLLYFSTNLHFLVGLVLLLVHSTMTKIRIITTAGTNNSPSIARLITKYEKVCEAGAVLHVGCGGILVNAPLTVVLQHER